MTELEKKAQIPDVLVVGRDLFERLSFYLGRSLILVFVTTFRCIWRSSQQVQRCRRI